MSASRIAVFADHFSDPGRTVGLVSVSLCVSGQQLLNEMAFDLDVWFSSLPYDVIHKTGTYTYITYCTVVNGEPGHGHRQQVQKFS